MLFALGSNGCGQLGLDHTDDVSIPSHVRLDDDSSVLQIAAGGNHTLILLSNGIAYICGKNNVEIGEETEAAQIRANNLQPTVMASSCTNNAMSVDVVEVAATWCASFSLYSNGSIVSVGEGEHGELGLGTGVTKVCRPSMIGAALLQNVHFVHIASCMAHTVAVASDGQVWGWGKGGKGQLGEHAQDVWEPRNIAGIGFPASRAACGRDFTCIIGSKITGEIALLGPNRADRFGIRKGAPTSVPGWKSIVASWGSIYILKEDGSVIAWGRNDHGQLPPANLPAIEAIAAGSEHCLALTKAGQVLAWGWGEHGNCGELTDKNGDVKVGNNKLAVDGQVAAVFAGCATSFVITSDL